MPDGFHPNEAGEQYMAGNFYNALLPVLQAMKSISATMVPYTHDTQVTAGSVLNLSATVHAYPCVSDVAFVNDTMVLGHGTQMPDSSFSYSFNVSQPGFNNIRAVVTDFTGRIDTSNAILFGAASNTVAVPLTISQIQGSTAPSPNANVLAKTTGIVTAVRKDSTGFWIQDSISDPNHVVSSGLFVSRNSTVTMPHPGDLVLVRGIVQDFQPLSKYLPQTRLSCVDSIAVLASGMRLPAAQFISVVPNGPFDISTLMSQYPGYEGMLLSFGATAIVAPSSQQCAFVPAGNLGSGSGVYLSSRVAVNESRASQIVDYNPEALLLGSKTCALPPARALDTLISLTGVADYDNGFISIQPIADSLRISHSATPVSPVSKRSSNSGTLRITTFDLGGLFDTLDQWGKNDPVLSAAAYKVKLAKTGKAINAELLMPAILCVQNCENTQVFADLAAYVNKSGGKYKIATARHYMGFSVDTPSTTDPRGLINGFLYDSTQFGLDSVKLIRGGSIDSSFGAYSALPAAQPVVGFFRVSGTQLAIVNFSLCDKSGDDPYFCYSWPLAAISKTVRDAQAAAVRAWIDRKLASVPSQLMLVAGEFNDYPFAEATDGAGYPVSIVAGNPAKGETVFYNAYDYLSPDSRYTCIANGRAQMTEQVLVSPGLASYAKAVDVLHFNANFEDSFASDSTTAVRCSNSDPIEVRF
jgi:predicted extracellular nuclease